MESTAQGTKHFVVFFAKDSVFKTLIKKGGEEKLTERRARALSVTLEQLQARLHFSFSFSFILSLSKNLFSLQYIARPDLSSEHTEGHVI